MDDSIIRRSSSIFFNFSFENDLSISRVYEKIKFRRTVSSLVSVEEAATRWSTISRLSTMDRVSFLSVFNLAITPVEVFNSSAISSNNEPHTFPQSSEEINQAQGQRSDTLGAGNFGALRNNRKAPTSIVLPKVLKKYNINDDWQRYRLYIVVYGDEERCLGLSEQPLVVFQQLERDGYEPTCMLRKKATPASIKPIEVYNNSGYTIYTPGAENLEALRINIEDPTSIVLAKALKKYEIKDHWQRYKLCVVYGDEERHLSLSEQPVVVFQQLERDGYEPRFMLRKKTTRTSINLVEVYNNSRYTTLHARG